MSGYNCSSRPLFPYLYYVNVSLNIIKWKTKHTTRRRWMYVILGNHFVPLEGKFLLIAWVIVKVSHHSKTCCQTLKHFDNVISTCCENVVEVFESLTTSIWMMDTLSIANAISKNLPSSGTKWLPIMMCIHLLHVVFFCFSFYYI